MKVFLRMKHWQLFILLIAIPVTLDMAGTVLAVSKHNTDIITYGMPVVILLPALVFFAWFYSMGLQLHKKLQAHIKIGLGTFKVFMWLTLAYTLFICMFTFSKGAAINSRADLPDFIVILFIFLLHLFIMFCMFYCLYINAKLLKAVELQRQVTFSDFAGDFFLLWFFPFGIWVVQPRINGIFAKGKIKKEFGNDTIITK